MLGFELVAFLRVVRQAVAADPPDGITAQLLDAVEVGLGPGPVVAGPPRSEPLPGFGIAHRPATQREASVAAAGALRNATCLVEAHALTRPREREGTRAARDPSSDDGHLGRAVQPRSRKRVE